MATLAYAYTNLLTGLAASKFTVTTGAGPADDTRLYLNDAKMDLQYTLTAGTTAEVITIDMGASTACSGFAVLNHNLYVLGAGTIGITATDDVTWATGVVTVKSTTTVNTTKPKHKDSVLQFATVTKRYWRIRFTHTLSLSLKIGEILAYSAATQLSRYFIDGSDESERVFKTTTQMLFGDTRSVIFGGPLRELRMRFADFTDAQILELRTMWEASGFGVTPILSIASYEATSSAAAVAEQNCVFGQMVLDDFRWTYVDFAQRQPPDIVIRSLGREAGA